MTRSGYSLTPLPMLKSVRESYLLSRRALAKKSGVAPDTIRQIERGERLARRSTTEKLATALNLDPFMLTYRLEELASLTKEDLRDAGATKDGLTNLRASLIYVGYAQVKDEQEKKKVAASYYELLDDIKAAYNTLLLEDMNLADGSAVAEVLARASARLLHYLTGELEALGEPKDYEEPEDYEDILAILASVAGAIDRGRRQLIDAWLEGAAATKKLLDVVDKAKAKEGGDARAENRVDAG